MDRITLVQEEPRGPSQLIEIPVGANGLTKVMIPDIQQLRSTAQETIVLKSLRLITAKVLTHAPLNGGVVAPRAELIKMSLVLYSEGWEKAQLIPLLTLNDNADADGAVATTIPYRNRTTRFDNWQNVDWSKSFVQYSNGQPSANQPYVIVLEAEYVKINSAGKEIK